MLEHSLRFLAIVYISGRVLTGTDSVVRDTHLPKNSSRLFVRIGKLHTNAYDETGFFCLTLIELGSRLRRSVNCER